MSKDKHVEIDDSELQEFLAELRGFKGVETEVGILPEGASRTYENGMTVGQVAAMHEYGAGVPRRSWLRDWAQLRRRDIHRKMEAVLIEAVKRASTGMILSGMEQIGEWAVQSIQQRIQAGIAPPNAESTIRSKGSSIPLIDTRLFISSIDSKTKKSSNNND